MKKLQSHFPTCLIEKWIKQGYNIKHIFGKIYYFKTEKRFIFGDKKTKEKIKFRKASPLNPTWRGSGSNCPGSALAR